MTYSWNCSPPAATKYKTVFRVRSASVTSSFFVLFLLFPTCGDGTKIASRFFEESSSTVICHFTDGTRLFVGVLLHQQLVLTSKYCGLYFHGRQHIIRRSFSSVTTVPLCLSLSLSLSLCISLSLFTFASLFFNFRLIISKPNQYFRFSYISFLFCLFNNLFLISFLSQHLFHSFIHSLLSVFFSFILPILSSIIFIRHSRLSTCLLFFFHILPIRLLFLLSFLFFPYFLPPTPCLFFKTNFCVFILTVFL
ncbi:unnamed protein product [Acanthosepion pharaonis]|uniref:Uncharacterized protein n=1 Tax=Acanthosepion pharaonis TaxID=158019 RepID=A0A812EM49_ACAPH|nr:unnamed protein product [Sepia pharaonis]